MTDIFEGAGFRRATTLQDKVAEAAALFRAGAAARTAHDRYLLTEAMSTSDFPVLLGKGFEVEAMQAQKDAVKEYEQFAFTTTVPDFRPKKLRDLFGSTMFDDVAEGEEYKGDVLEETEIEVKVGKTGRSFGYTWELALSGDFTNMADFPKRLGNAAVETENDRTHRVFVTETGPNAAFFDTVGTKRLTAENLDAAISGLALKEDHRGDLVDTSKLILVVPPSLQVQAQRLLNAAELELKVQDGSKTATTKVSNPFRGLVELQVSRSLVRIDKSGTRASSWYLLPGRETANPAVVKAGLIGHESVDIRVKRDQGERIGGGQPAFDDGSFKDDTVWFRGRHVFGAAAGFNYAAYASTGTTD